jgi:hypothetical protein
MPRMIRFKLPKTTPEYGYIYINAKSIHAIKPCDDWARVFYGHGNDVYVEHMPIDIVDTIENDFDSVTDSVVGDFKIISG